MDFLSLIIQRTVDRDFQISRLIFLKHSTIFSNQSSVLLKKYRVLSE